MKARILALALAAAAMPAAAGATIFTFYTTLAGSNESPANASPGTGFATLVWDDLAHTASYDITFSGLIGTVTASHTHSPTPGQLTACGLAPVAHAEPFRDCRVQDLASKEAIGAARTEIKAMLTQGLAQVAPKLDAYYDASDYRLK